MISFFLIFLDQSQLDQDNLSIHQALSAKILEEIVRQLMFERKITIRLTSETAKLYDEYRKKCIPEKVPDSQIIRAGLSILMILPDAVVSNAMDKLQKENEQITTEMKEIIKKHPDPQLYELWKKLMGNVDKIGALLENSVQKYADVVGEGKKGRKPDPNKKHTPGRPTDQGYEN